MYALTLFLLGATALASDLLLDGETLTLSGAHSYDKVTLINGSSLIVAPYDGVGSGGWLSLQADIIAIDSTSSISARGAGHPGIVGEAGAGPGGGGCGRDGRRWWRSARRARGRWLGGGRG